MKCVYGGTRYQSEHHAKQMQLAEVAIIYDVEDLRSTAPDVLYLVGDYTRGANYDKVLAYAHSNSIRVEARHP